MYYIIKWENCKDRQKVPINFSVNDEKENHVLNYDLRY